MDIHPAARRHGVRDNATELAIHAMNMRSEYRPLLPGTER
jgi:hypothetical protein